MGDSKLVYSTSKAAPKDKSNKVKSLSGGGHKLKMRLESKGRGGKAVTVLFELPMSGASAEELLRELKSKMGCGGTYKNNVIELQGDLRQKVAALLTTKGLQVIQAGG